jgi:hypothetical protein
MSHWVEAIPLLAIISLPLPPLKPQTVVRNYSPVFGEKLRTKSNSKNIGGIVVSTAAFQKYSKSLSSSWTITEKCRGS